MKVNLSKTAMIAILLIILITVSTDTVTKAIAEPDSIDYVHIPESKAERARRDEITSRNNNVENMFANEFEDVLDFIILISE